MIPVRKPGRPLSVCPHPPNKPCGCGGITAAIPRMQRCGCGANSVAGSPQTATETPPARVTGSPPRRTFHVHKQGAKQGTRIDSASLERIDPNQLNIHPPPPPPPWGATPMPMGNGGFVMPAHHPSAAPIPYHPPLVNGFHSGGSAEYGIPYAMPPQQVSPMAMRPTGGLAAALDQQQRISASRAANDSTGRVSISSAQTAGSCCAPTTPGSPLQTPASSMASATSAAETPGGTQTCCAPKQPGPDSNGYPLPQYRQGIAFQQTDGRHEDERSRSRSHVVSRRRYGSALHAAGLPCSVLPICCSCHVHLSSPVRHRILAAAARAVETVNHGSGSEPGRAVPADEPRRRSAGKPSARCERSCSRGHVPYVQLRRLVQLSRLCSPPLQRGHQELRPLGHEQHDRVPQSQSSKSSKPPRPSNRHSQQQQLCRRRTQGRSRADERAGAGVGARTDAGAAIAAAATDAVGRVRHERRPGTSVGQRLLLRHVSFRSVRRRNDELSLRRRLPMYRLPDPQLEPG